MNIEPTTDRDLTTHTGSTDQADPSKAYNTSSPANTQKVTDSPTGQSDGGT